MREGPPPLTIPLILVGGVDVKEPDPLVEIHPRRPAPSLLLVAPLGQVGAELAADHVGRALARGVLG